MPDSLMTLLIRMENPDPQSDPRFVGLAETTPFRCNRRLGICLARDVKHTFIEVGVMLKTKKLRNLVVSILMTMYASQSDAGDGRVIVPDGAAAVPNRYIVVFNSDVKDNELSPLQARQKVETAADVLSAMHGAVKQRIFSHALDATVMSMTAETARAVSRRPEVLFVEQVSLAVLNGNQSSPPWGLDRIDQEDLPLDSNYGWDFDGSGVEIVVIDGGVRTSHVDFQGRAFFGANCLTATSPSFACTGSNIGDPFGHGTHVAATAAGATYGVAKNATILSVNVCLSTTNCPTDAILGALDWASDRKGSNPTVPMVVNMSLGGPSSPAWDNAVNGVVNDEIFVAVSAGNDFGADACLQSPARASGAFAVASTNIDDYRSNFSNIGSCVSVFAPGGGITSAYNGSDTDVNVLSGTSMASPHVAGVAALVLDENPSWSPSQVGQAIVNRATSGVVINPGTNSPNKLLYSIGPLPDTDQDGIRNDVDNCPLVPNANQIDSNEDGTGNACTPGLFAALSIINELLYIPDSDEDNIDDEADNCLAAKNGPAQSLNQIDTDLDGYGNSCDPDYDQSWTVTGADFAVFVACFNHVSPPPALDPTCVKSDFDGSGTIGGTDFAIFLQYYGSAPGPSGLSCAGVSAPCTAP